MYVDDHQINTNDNDIQKAAQTLRQETNRGSVTMARRTYRKPTLRNTRSLPLIGNLPGKPLGMQ